MKKILSLALSVLLIVCGVVPAFVTGTAATDSTMLAAAGKTLPEAYKNGDSLHFKDFVEDNSDLVLGSDYSLYDSVYGDSVGVFMGATFAATFYVDVPGIYEFCIKNYVRADDTWNYIQPDGTTKYPHAGTVRVDDSEVYTVSCNAVLAAGESAFSGGYHFGGFRVELSAGYHTIYLSSDQTSAGTLPYFMDAYWYCAERTGFSEEMPVEDAITVTEVDTTEAALPGTVEVTLPYNGTYSIAALVKNTSGTAGAFTATIDDTKYSIFEIDGVAAGKSLYYDVAEGVVLEAGTHTVKIATYGSKSMPEIDSLVFAVTELTGIASDTNPYTKATAVNFREQISSNTLQDDGGYNFYGWEPKDYKNADGEGYQLGTTKGGVLINDPTYTYTVKFTPTFSGEYTLAMFLAHRTDKETVKTTSFDVTVSAGDDIVGEYGFTEFTGKRYSQMYYELAQGVALKAGVEYTVAVTQAGATDSTIVDFLYEATKYDTVSEKTPNVGFENAEVINLRSQTENNGGYGGSTYYPWNSTDFSARGQFPVLGKDTVLLNTTSFVYKIKFTPAETDAYSFALYLANRTTKNNGKDPLDSTKAGAFTVTLSDADGVIETYTITEVQPAALSSRLYYHFADDVALEAGVEYTVSFQMVTATDSTIVDFLYESTVVVDEAIAEANKPEIEGGGTGSDTAAEIPVGVINPLPGVVGAGEAENQPFMNVINPLPDTDASDNVPAEDESVPPQPNFTVSTPAAPGAFGNHYMIPALPALMP